MKKISNYSLVIFCLILTLNVNAQNFAIGVRGGLSIPNLSSPGHTDNPISTGYKSRVGPQFGISGEYKVSKLFSLQVLLDYSAQGGKKNGFQAFPNTSGYPPTYLYADFKSQVKINYLMIPVLAKFGWNLGESPFRVYAAGGPFVSKLLSAHQVTTGSSVIYASNDKTEPVTVDQEGNPYPVPFNNNQDLKKTDQVHKSNVGVMANVGVIYNMGRSAVFIEGGFNYGFIHIQKGTTNGQDNTGAGTLVVGYTYWLGKKS